MLEGGKERREGHVWEVLVLEGDEGTWGGMYARGRVLMLRREGVRG